MTCPYHRVLIIFPTQRHDGSLSDGEPFGERECLVAGTFETFRSPIPRERRRATQRGTLRVLERLGRTNKRKQEEEEAPEQMRPTPPSRVARDLQAADEAPTSFNVSTLEPRCSAEALGNATFGSKAQLACADATGFSFFLLPGRPTDDQIKRMCGEQACKTTVQAIRHALESECQLPNGGTPLFLHRDVLTPVVLNCGFEGGRRFDASSSSSSAGERSGDTIVPPVQSTTSSSSSALTAGPIIAVIIGAIVCGLLAAFIASQLKRRKHELTSPTDQWRPHQPSEKNQTPSIDEVDEFYSQRSFAEFTAIATSSKVSSNQSRASTSRSSKHSVGSYADGDLVIASPHVDTVESVFEDPALVMLRIPINKIQVAEMVSQDGLGLVYSGTYDHQLPVAIKKLLPGKCEEIRELSLFLGEAKLLARLSHERIERLVGVAWDPNDQDPWLLTEFASGGDLRGFLNRYAVEQRLVGFSIEKVKIALQVAEALYYLHTLDPVVLYRNLRSQSVLLTSEYDAVVTDVGVLRERDTSDTFNSSLWTAPEVLMGKRFDEKADVFSFGVLLSEIDTHKLPYADVHDHNGRPQHVSVLQRQVSSGELRVSFSERADPDMVQLGRQCIALQPRDRPTALEIYQRVNEVMKSYVAFV